MQVLQDIANEECVHAGEFLRLLRKLAYDEEEFYAKGAKEAEEIIEKMSQRIPGISRPTNGIRGQPPWALSPPRKREPLCVTC